MFFRFYVIDLVLQGLIYQLNRYLSMIILLIMVFNLITLYRFVRFVNQPEVVERFVTLEKEIVQIENSIQSNELTSSKAVVQAEGT